MRTIYLNQSLMVKLSFAQWFALRRNIVNVTQSQIAKELGVSSQTISNWENKVSQPNLNPEQTLKLCLILNVSLEELVKGFKGEVVINQ